jgi:hypothetical protein
MGNIRQGQNTNQPQFGYGNLMFFLIESFGAIEDIGASVRWDGKRLADETARRSAVLARLRLLLPSPSRPHCLSTDTESLPPLAFRS